MSEQVQKSHLLLELTVQLVLELLGVSEQHLGQLLYLVSLFVFLFVCLFV